MKTLIITAHPSTTGHVHRIANTYSDSILALGGEVHIHDLYNSTHQFPFLKFESSRDWPMSEALTFFQDEIRWADEIVFIHPIWWGGQPAILKNWLDHVLQTRFAYQYVDNKRIGLLTGKCAKVFATSGGPAYLYDSFFSPFKLTWKIAINEYCGLNQKEILVCGNMAKPNREEIFEKFLEKVKSSAN